MQKLIQILTLSGMVSVSALAHADERTDINQVLKEIHYIKEVVANLRKQHSNCSEKVCFYYDGLINQLNQVEFGIKEYLNLNIQELHMNPNKPLVSPTYRVKQN